MIGVAQIQSGDYADAIVSLEGAGDGVLADLTNALLLAWAHFGAGDSDAALAGLAALEGEEWYEPFKLLHSGYIAMAAGRTEEGLGFFDEAHEIDPNAQRITEAYARALASAGRKDEAEAALAEFLTSYPDNALAQKALDAIRSGATVSQPVTTPAEGAAEALAGLGAAVGQEGGIEVAYLYLGSRCIFRRTSPAASPRCRSAICSTPTARARRRSGSSSRSRLTSRSGRSARSALR